MEDRLKKFAHLVDAGSYTKAAAEMHLSQPALTAAIQKLERELRTPLLLRTNPLRMTDAGKLAYDTAKELSISTTNLSLKLAEQALKKPAVTVGMIDSIADTFFGQSTGFEQLEKQASVSVVVNNSRYLSQAVARDELDIAFITESSSRNYDTLVARRIGAEPLVVVCHTEMYDETVAAITHGQLLHFVSYDQPSTTYQLIQKTFTTHKLQPNTILHSTSPDIMLRLVLSKRAVAVLPYLLVKPYLDAQKLAPLTLGSDLIIERSIDVIHYRGKVLPAPMSDVIQILQDTLTKLMHEAKHLQ